MPSINQLQFYLARAQQARDEAENATLAHVRERCHRSEAAWTQLADRAARSEAMRARIEKMKADETAETRHETAFDELGPERPHLPPEGGQA